MSQRADILVTHEAPGAHPCGFQVLDELALNLGACLLVHGHHHKSIDYRLDGSMHADNLFRAFGVDMATYLAWPLESVPDGPRP